MKSIKPAFIIVLLGVVSLLSGCLTGTIRGQVIDNYDRPVVGAIVSTRPPTESVRTTEDGYVIKNVPVGEYRVIADKPGYHEGSQEIQVQWSQTTGADIQIERKE
ncbi:MAG: carboxypeptidase-like regulatory domain-containing protein [bacterium]